MMEHNNSSSNVTNDAADVLLQEMRVLLEEQYDITLDYCNALTLLHNTTTTAIGGGDDSDDTNLHRAWENVMLRVSRVQRHKQAMMELTVRSSSSMMITITTTTMTPPHQQLRRLHRLWTDHVACTERILATIHEQGNPAKVSWHGIPLALATTTSVTSITDTQTLALSTLKASVQEVLLQISNTTTATMASSSLSSDTS